MAIPKENDPASHAIAKFNLLRNEDSSIDPLEPRKNLSPEGIKIIIDRFRRREIDISQHFVSIRKSENDQSDNCLYFIVDFKDEWVPACYSVLTSQFFFDYVVKTRNEAFEIAKKWSEINTIGPLRRHNGEPFAPSKISVINLD